MFRALLIPILLTHLAHGCLWDRDTLAEEAKGRPDLVKLIVGWFDRYPPEYYQMRLGRVVGELKSDPENLDLHDDAAVACDRLGRSDEAIDWMTKKKALIDALPANEGKAQRYRYLANLGTFHAHRWVSQPQKVRDSNLSDLREAEKPIAQAIKENPDAHFGREVYQLMAIRWMLWDGVSPIDVFDDTQLMPDETHWVDCRDFMAADPEAIDGISGLIQLGAGWQSADAFRSLAALLDNSRLSSIAELAYLREGELLAAGKGSLHPVAAIRERIHPAQSRFLEKGYMEAVRDYFPIARAAADKRNAAWMAYQKERFAKGMHPDTNPDFWNAWAEPGFPKAPGPGLMQYLVRNIERHPVLVLSVAVVSVSLFVMSFFRVTRWLFARRTAASA